jgi:Tol biopolymer transport system component
MKNDMAGQKPSLTRHNPKLLTGSTIDKFPVVLDNGKTIIFISDPSKEAECRLKYSMRGVQTNVK